MVLRGNFGKDPAITKNSQALRGNRIDPTLILPALVIAMGLESIKFDAEVVVTVQIVEIAPLSTVD